MIIKLINGSTIEILPSGDATRGKGVFAMVDRYICNRCNSTFDTDFYRCPECCKGYITLNN